jgi:aspartyl-tRNA(Asn)/glutamyl-tRNA(Gln) amidotransferase subunit A
MAALTQLSVAEAARRIRAGELTSQDLTRAVLQRIQAVDPQVGAYLSVDGEDALRQAQVADAARAAGSQAPLLGVPVAIKDVLNVKGQPCTCGSQILKGYRAPYDATAVAKLRAAGAVILGRLNMDEFAMGSSTENSAYQLTRNPWNLACVPGGSSGGSAAAVAADWRRRRSAPTPADPSASRPRCAAAWGSSRRTGASPATGWWRMRRRSTRSVR